MIVVELPEGKIGVYAPDPEAYALFAPLLDGVIKNAQGLPEKKPIHHPALDFGDLEKVKLDDLDPEGKYVTGCSVSAARSLEGYAFLSLLTKESLEEVEEKAKEALKTLTEDLEGSYQTLADLDSDVAEQLLKEGNLFSDSDKSVEAAGGYKDWPRGRGVFHNAEKTLVVWVGQEDHLRVTSKQPGPSLAPAYARLVKALKALGEKLTFVRDDRLGFVTFSPANLGTSLRVTVTLRIPTAAQHATFQTTLDKLHLVCEASEEEGSYTIRNKRSVGLTEIQLVTEIFNGAKDLIKLEHDLTWKPETLQEMVDLVSKTKSCKSMMKKYLTKDVADRLKDKKTTLGGTLVDCIRTGAWNLDSDVGIMAADAESYTVFADIFDPIIKDYHKLKSSDPITHPADDFGDLENLDLPDLDPENEMIVSTRIRLARSHKEYGFPPVLTKEDREAMEKKTVEALENLGEDLQGTYYPLSDMSPDTQEQLTKDHFLFRDNDRFLKAANGYEDWPGGRGIYFNEAKSFLVWVNEEDHLRVISMQNGGDVGAVYKRLAKAVKTLGEKLTFARDDRLGYLTFCPTNLGTSIRASVHIKIPKLSARKDFKATCDKLKLQARGVHGEHSESEGGVYDLSNKRRLGLTEVQVVQDMCEGVKEIIRLEKELQAGKGAKSSSCNII
ncbi:hypothetical protein ACOMHN_023533 [Nucella lapillus]